MDLSQMRKQLRLLREVSGTKVYRDTRSEDFIASYLSESPTGQILLRE